MSFPGGNKYRFRTVWLGSEEPIAWIAERTGAFLDGLGAVFGVDEWYDFFGKTTWPASPEAREQLVADGVHRDDNGVAWPRSGYSLTMSSRGSAVSMQAWITAGRVGFGRNLPAHTVDLWMWWRSEDSPSGEQIESMFAPTIDAWDPVAASFTDLDIGRSGWQTQPGWRVWLRNDIGRFETLAEGLSAVELGGGTLLRAPDDWTPEQVESVVGGTLEANGLTVLPFDEAAG